MLACCGQDKGTTGPRVGLACFCCLSPLGEVSLEASTGFLVGRVGAYPLVVRAGS